MFFIPFEFCRIFIHSRRFFTINSIIKYAGIVLGTSGLIITLFAMLAAESNNKNVKTIQPSTNLATLRAVSAATTTGEKSELEKERY